MNRSFVNNIIPSPVNKEYAVFNGNFDTQDIINNILLADARSWKETRLLSKQFTKNNLYKLWLFVKTNIRYREDKSNQYVKHPARAWADKKADCKSMSLFIGTVLRNMGIPYKYRFVSYKPGDVTHVYVIAMLGNKKIILDAVHDTYNEEVPYHSGIDYTPKQNGNYEYAKVSGIQNSSIKNILVLAGIVFIGYKLFKAA